jgi:hypothetical protein
MLLPCESFIAWWGIGAAHASFKSIDADRDMLWHISYLVGIHSLVEEGCGRVEGHGSVIVTVCGLLLHI